MSLAVTSSIVWWARRPLIAANIPRIIWGSLPFWPRLPLRGPAWPCGCGGCGSSDHRAVDVREHLLPHVVAVDSGDDGAVLGGDHEGRLVDEDEGGASALRRGPVDARTEAGLVDRDVS